MSFEKWLIDGELFRMPRKTIAAGDIAVNFVDSDTILETKQAITRLAHDCAGSHTTFFDSWVVAN